MSGNDAPPAGESRSAAGDRNPWLIAVVVSIAIFMQVLDTSIANVALRHIAGSLAASVDESTWVITTYLVASAIIVPVSGWLMSVVGRKRFYMIGVAVFTASSLLCGLSTSLTMLVFFRIIQALGGGGMVPAEQAILADTFPPAQRAGAFGLYGVAVIIAPTIGPTVGGWITDNYSWHWIFFINVPIGIMSLVLVQWLLVEPEALQRERREMLQGGVKVDWVGFALVAIWLGSLEVVLDEGEREGWFQSNFIVGITLVAVISFLAFIPWELPRSDPIVDIRLLFRRQFGGSFLMMLAVGAVLFSTTQLLPQLLETNFDYTATISGLALMPGGIVMLVIMPPASQAANYVQPRYLMALGTGAVAIAMWYMTLLSPDASFGFFAWGRIFQMIGLPFLFVPITAASYAGLPPNKTNQASALINVARNLGGSIGVSAATSMLAERTQFHQARLSEHIFAASPAYQTSLSRLSGELARGAVGSADAQHQAIGVIGQTLATQASLLSYIDVFWAFAILAALMVPMALFMLKNITLGEAAAAH